MSRKEVYDIETLAGCFTYTGKDINDKSLSVFVIHPLRNDLFKFYEHLKNVSWAIGFNNCNFDYPVIHWMLINKDKLLKLDAKSVIRLIHKEATKIIEVQNQKDFFKSVAIKTADCYINQIDLFKIWHYNNAARSTSLKALEVAMGLDSVQDMPINHNKESLTWEEVEEVLKYNLNDVEATYQFYLKSIDKIKLRISMKEKYGLDCLNYSNGKLGEQLILKLYCDKTGRDFWEVRKLRTYRQSIALKDCIPYNVSFETKQFNDVLQFFKDKVINNTKGAFTKSIVYKGIGISYGTGGIHGLTIPGIYESDKDFIIKTVDVASLYPNIPIKYRFTIEHLGMEFLDVYENDIVGVRMAEKAKPKELQDLTIVDGYKEAANIPYGKSNDENSPLYDPLYTLKTTVHGQLLISMLVERLSLIKDAKVLMINTDGLEVKIPRNQVETFNTICREWEDLTKLTLEEGEYSKMCIRDVNNYIAISTKGKIKNKGAFEVDKVIGSEPAYHKDNSFRIVPLAVQEYFVKGIIPEVTIKNHLEKFEIKDSLNSEYVYFEETKVKPNLVENKGILDFCGRQKFNKDSYGEVNYLVDGKVVIEKQQKNTRYYVSTDGGKFIKRYHKGTSENIHLGYQVTIFNNRIDKNPDDYNLDYSFYIKEAYKMIYSIKSNQLELNFE